MRGVLVEIVHVSVSGRIEPKALAIGEHVLGRDKGCALRVPSSLVSRRHCAFQVTEAGISIRDLGSSNGTWVNAERIQMTQLRAGDLIAVGPVVFVVRIDGDPETIDPVLLYEQGRPRIEDTASIEEHVGTAGVDAGVSGSAIGLNSPLVDPEGSSIIEFEFDLSDIDDEEQPPL